MRLRSQRLAESRGNGGFLSPRRAEWGGVATARTWQLIGEVAGKKNPASLSFYPPDSQHSLPVR